MSPISKVARSLTQTFLAGVFVILPLVITVAVVVWVADFLGGLIGPGTVLGRALGAVGLRFAASATFAYVIGWVIVLAAVFGLGILVRMGAQRFFQDKMDTLAKRVPLLGGVYGTVRQLIGMMDTKGSSEMKGMSVVFCVFGKETGAAFLALLPTPEVFHINDVDYHAVLIPTAPMPMGGSLIFVPKDAVKPANVTVDAFMSIYVSMGMTGPQFLTVSESPLPK